MKYFVIGDEDTVLGFSLVGVSGMSAASKEEAERVFNKALENKEFGVIIITLTVANMIRSLVDRYLYSEAFPLIVEIPDSRPGSAEPDIRALVNDAIGVSL